MFAHIIYIHIYIYINIYVNGCVRFVDEGSLNSRSLDCGAAATRPGRDAGGGGAGSDAAMSRSTLCAYIYIY